MELPSWLQQLFEGKEGASSGHTGRPDGEPPRQSKAAAATIASTGAAFGYTQSPEEDERSGEEVARDDQMMLLTKKMIEIRSILQLVGQSDTLILPSIVVIGSQSSGKSSVLEAIVGHEFLPKGSNMITRRPIELTLVSTPNAKAEYGEFPALGLGKITDFAQIQKTLTDLNLAVPATECVSDDPIQLTISSPNVPDLSLIDLPGYIQVSGSDQPPELKQKISDLCDKYIQPPNVVLAISAADVDLANSTALRASRRVDPRGERTIGVITKMDLVEAQRGADILSDRKYPLRLGYVGVVSRIPPSTGGLFSRGSGNITSAITKNENSYFSAHPLEFGPTSELAVGTSTLRKKLMHVLEQTMAASLQGTTAAVQRELEEATYEFKVQYNDRPLSAESYLAESLDTFKHSFKEFSESFGRPQVRELLKAELDQRVLDLLAQRYWNKPINDLSPAMPEPDPLSDLPKADPNSLYWHRKLDASASSLTKLGVGRLATTVVADALSSGIDQLVAASTFNSHPFAQRAITEAASGILNERFYSTSDQVENCIKPFKFEVDVDENEWMKGRANVTDVLNKELKACDESVRRVEVQVGGRKKLKDVTAYIERVRKGEVVLEGDGVGGGGGFSAALLAKGKHVSWTPHSSLHCKQFLTGSQQVERRSSSITVQICFDCDSQLLNRSPASPQRKSTFALSHSWMPWPPNLSPHQSSSSMSNSYPNFIINFRESLICDWVAAWPRTKSNVLREKTHVSQDIWMWSSERSCWNWRCTRWKAFRAWKGARMPAGKRARLRCGRGSTNQAGSHECR